MSTLILWVLAFLPPGPPEKRKRPGREDDNAEQSLDQRVDARAQKQKDARALTHHTPITPDHY